MNRDLQSTVEASCCQAVSGFVKRDARDLDAAAVRVGHGVDELASLGLPHLHHRLGAHRDQLIRLAVKHHLQHTSSLTPPAPHRLYYIIYNTQALLHHLHTWRKVCQIR